MSFIGVFIGTSLLVVVLSIFNGFQSQIKKSIFKFDPHITIENQSGTGKIKEWPKWITKIKAELGDKIESIEPMIQSAAIVRKENMIDHVFLRGQNFAESKDGKSYVFPADFPRVVKPRDLKMIPEGYQCLIGREMAVNMDIRVGDKIEIIVPRGQFSARVGIRPSMKSFTVAGYFKTGHYQYDSRVIIVSFTVAQKLYNIKNSTQQIVVKLKDLDSLASDKSKIHRVLPLPFYSHTVEEDQRNFFAALKLEKTIMTIIVFLFIIAAMVGIVVATQHTVRSKRRDIGILKSLGVSNQGIGFIFTLNGFIMGTVGSTLGILFGIFLAINLESIVNGIQWCINTFGRWYTNAFTDGFWIKRILIPKDVYYFDHLPISIEADFLIPLAVASIILSALASFIPAWIASKMEPIDIIRKGEL